jgi:hypothetical protein
MKKINLVLIGLIAKITILVLLLILTLMAPADKQLDYAKMFFGAATTIAVDIGKTKISKKKKIIPDPEKKNPE